MTKLTRILTLNDQLNLTLTHSLDAYENILTAIGIETCKTRTMANAITRLTCAIYVYMILKLYGVQSI